MPKTTSIRSGVSTGFRLVSDTDRHSFLVNQLLTILLLGEQRHDGCEQFTEDCYPTASRLRFEPGPFCA